MGTTFELELYLLIERFRVFNLHWIFYSNKCRFNFGHLCNASCLGMKMTHTFLINFTTRFNFNSKSHLFLQYLPLWCIYLFTLYVKKKNGYIFYVFLILILYYLKYYFFSPLLFFTLWGDTFFSSIFLNLFLLHITFIILFFFFLFLYIIIKKTRNNWSTSTFTTFIQIRTRIILLFQISGILEIDLD